MADHLRGDGTVVGCCGNRLALLKLRHGDRRVTVEEAAARPASV